MILKDILNNSIFFFSSEKIILSNLKFVSTWIPNIITNNLIIINFIIWPIFNIFYIPKFSNLFFFKIFKVIHFYKSYFSIKLIN